MSVTLSGPTLSHYDYPWGCSSTGRPPGVDPWAEGRGVVTLDVPDVALFSRVGRPSVRGTEFPPATPHLRQGAYSTLGTRRERSEGFCEWFGVPR